MNEWPWVNCIDIADLYVEWMIVHVLHMREVEWRYTQTIPENRQCWYNLAEIADYYNYKECCGVDDDSHLYSHLYSYSHRGFGRRSKARDTEASKYPVPLCVCIVVVTVTVTPPNVHVHVRQVQVLAIVSNIDPHDAEITM